jgi:catechol 2,3-dioxygenase-like lactoylglutathione lyase family enzyme
VSDFGASLRFYRDHLGLTEVALYDDPPYATLSVAGARISLAEQGHPAPDRPGVTMAAPADPSRANVVLVLEVPDADLARKCWSRGAFLFWPRRTGRRGAAAGSSAWTPTATSSRSSSPPEPRGPRGPEALVNDNDVALMSLERAGE